MSDDTKKELAAIRARADVDTSNPNDSSDDWPDVPMLLDALASANARIAKLEAERAPALDKALDEVHSAIAELRTLVQAPVPERVDGAPENRKGGHCTDTARDCCYLRSGRCTCPCGKCVTARAAKLDPLPERVEGALPERVQLYRLNSGAWIATMALEHLDAQLAAITSQRDSAIERMKRLEEAIRELGTCRDCEGDGFTGHALAPEGCLACESTGLRMAARAALADPTDPPKSSASCPTCAAILASDPTRHFRECPQRAVYPDAPKETRPNE